MDFSAVDYTIAFWFKLKVDTGNWQVLFAISKSGGNRYDLWESDSGGWTAISMLSDPQNVFEDTNLNTSFTVDTWYYCAMTRSGGTLKAYLFAADGSVISSVTRGDTTPHTEASDRIEFGSCLDWSEGTDGVFAYIKIWTRVLTQNQLLSEMWDVAPVDSTNLWGWYPTLPGSGERNKDYSGNSYDLTEVGTLTDEDPPPVSWGAPVTPSVITASVPDVSITPQTAALGSVVYGTTDTYLQKDTGGIDANGLYTFMCWLRATTWPLESWTTPFSAVLAANWPGDYLQLYDPTPEGSEHRFEIFVAQATDSSGGVQSTSLYSINTWYHVCVVRESDTVYKMYIDGVLEATNPLDVNGREAITRSIIGASPGYGEFFDGRLGAVKMWTRALTQDEVKQEMYKVLPVSTVNLWAFLPTFSGSGERGKDYSGNGNTFSEYGTPSDADGPPISWGAMVQSHPIVITAEVIDLYIQDGVHGHTTETGVLELLQTIYPNADGSLGNWKNELGGVTNLYQSLDEGWPSEADFIHVVHSGTPNAAVIHLSDASDPGTGLQHVVKYRYGKVGTATPDLTVRLKQGTTTIATWTHLNISGTADAVQTLTEEQANSITDYTDLRLEFEAVS